MSRLIVNFMKKDNNAVIPSKGNDFAVGYDLTCIKKVDGDFLSTHTMYDTGICVEAPEGYYTEILPRSSFGKSGYVLANSCGIIDPDYRGTIKIMVAKISPNAPDLVLPFKLFQLVLRKNIEYDVKEVNELSETIRGSGGFGSTDEKSVLPNDFEYDYSYHCKDIYQMWCKDDKKHRDDDLPAVIYPDGTKEWWYEGKMHRNNKNENGYLPAQVWADGTMIWRLHGKIHRDGNKPAVIFGQKPLQEWWTNGVLVCRIQQK